MTDQFISILNKTKYNISSAEYKLECKHCKLLMFFLSFFR